MSKIVKQRISQQPTAAGIVNRIKADVQAFVTDMSGVLRDTKRLAPLVEHAYKQFREESEDTTKLAFCKLFATREQLAEWPETDQEARARGSKTQALFNGVEYLLRKAAQIRRMETRETEISAAVAEAERQARIEAKRDGLKGDAAAEYIAGAGDTARAKFKRGGSRVTQDDVVNLIEEGWYSELEDYDVFIEFVQKILALKYKDKTVAAIVEKATADIEHKQRETPAEAAEEESLQAGRILPMRHRAAA